MGGAGDGEQGATQERSEATEGPVNGVAANRNRRTLWWMAALYVGCGLLFIAIAIPLVQRRIGPNSWYGFRVERTLDDRERWYAANAYSGRQLSGASVVLIVVAVGTAAVMLRRGAVNVGLYVAICTVALLGGLIVAAVRSQLYLNGL